MTTDTIQDVQDTTALEQPAAEPKSASTAAQTDGAVGDGSTDPDAQQQPKLLTQDEVNELVKREKAKAEAKAERRVMRQLEKLSPQQAQQPAQQSPQQADDKPSRAQYASDEAYVDALTDWKLEQRDRQVQAKQQQEQSRSIVDRTERLYAEAEKVQGFDREDFDALPLTPAIVQAMLDSDVAARLMAHMAANPDDVARIAKLPPARQAAEIGKLEATLPTQTARKSNAPPPIEPTGRRGTAAHVDLSRASMDEYIAERKKQGASWAR